MKTCRTCGKEKPLSEFYLIKRANYVPPDCKMCSGASVKICVECGKGYVAKKRDTCSDECKRKRKNKQSLKSLYGEPGTYSKKNLPDCDGCAMLSNCQKRLKIELWVGCEKPDIKDIFRYEALSIQDRATARKLLSKRYSGGIVVRGSITQERERMM